MSTKVKIYKTVKSTIDKQSSLVDGLYFTTDTHELIVSVDSERFNVTDIEILKTESSRTSLLAPLTKFYYVLENNTLWYYDGSSWKSSVNIVNNLTSTNTAAVLSAAMGKKLNDEKLGKTESASSVKGTLTLTRGSTTMTYNGSEDKSFSIPNTPTDVGVIGTAPTSGQVAVFDGTTGKIKSTGFTLLKSVPADAKFTDTVYTHPKSGITAGSYRYVTVDDNGHITKGSNPTTLAGFGITDAASKVHNHDASSITSGVFDIDRIPKAAIPVLCRVADDTARFKLTTDNVQNGDTVKVESTGKMYYVVDQNKLSTESGYEPYTADAASSVPWSGITGKPSTYTPSTHTHTKSQITDFPSSIKNPNSVIVKLNGGTTEGTNMFTYDGSSAKTINITPSSIGAATSSHTHTKSQITDFPSTLKNPSSVIVKLNGGTTEGTNLFTYDGSAAKTINITPASIGAATSSHNHTKSQITDFPTTLKNPNSIIIKLNGGSTEGTNLFTYDGSAGKTINITPSAIGAAASTHTHTKSQITDFPTSMPASDVSAWAKASTKPTYTKSEVGLGNVDNTADANKSVKYATSAGSASKLSTDRTITLGGDASGSAKFDGSGDITISATVRKHCMVGSDAASSAGWYKVASQTMSGYGDTNVIFAVTSTYANYFSGIFSLQIRSDNTSIQCPKAIWLVRNGFAVGAIRIVISGMTWTMYVNQTNGQYGRIMFEIISQSTINDKNAGITLFNTSTKESTEPKATVTSSDGGTVSYANSAGTASALGTNAGNTTTPVYFANGKPVALGYTIAKSVPADAKFTDTVYTHPTTAGNKHIPSGGSANQILRWTADGTAVWGAEKTYSTGNASTAGITKLYTGTGSATDGTLTQKAITDALSGKAPSTHDHKYAGSSSTGGSANSAIKLATARSINGTSFDGSEDVTTAKWGTARDITVGNTSKSVNGSGNVSWSLAEIGIHLSTTEPTSNDGKNGDIWIVYEE